MKISERSYKGRSFRPRPEIMIEEQECLLIVATPWGSRQSAKKAIQIMSEFFMSAKGDKEVTSPFPWLTCLSPTANVLRTGVMLANDYLYREENRSEYQAGIEILVAATNNRELSFIQLGHPQVFLDRQDLPLFTVGSLTDLPLDYSQSKEQFPPLPSSLLGIHSTASLNVKTLRFNENDRLILLSHSFIPDAFYQTDCSDRSIEKISHLLSHNSPNEAFWLGQLTLP